MKKNEPLGGYDVSPCSRLRNDAAVVRASGPERGLLSHNPSPRPAFQPPSPYQPTLVNSFWYGTAALRVRLPSDGYWDHLLFNGKSYAQKIFWFSRDYDTHQEPRPEIVVKSRRVDVVDGPTFTLERGTNADLGDHQQAMLTGVILPTAGCWEISGQYRGKTLTFVIIVGP